MDGVTEDRFLTAWAYRPATDSFVFRLMRVHGAYCGSPGAVYLCAFAKAPETRVFVAGEGHPAVQGWNFHCHGVTSEEALMPKEPARVD